MADIIRFVIELNVGEGRLEDARQAIGPIVETVKTKDPGALSYDFYFSPNQTKLHIIECYKNSDAAINHMGIVADILPDLLKATQITRFEVFGNASEGLATLLSQMNAQIFPHWDGFTR